MDYPSQELIRIQSQRIQSNLSKAATAQAPDTRLFYFICAQEELTRLITSHGERPLDPSKPAL